MSWLKEVIGTEKAIISMLHLQAMPETPIIIRKRESNGWLKRPGRI